MSEPSNWEPAPRSRGRRDLADRAFVGLCLLAAAISIGALALLINSILVQALGFRFDADEHASPAFLTLLSGLSFTAILAGFVVTLINAGALLTWSGGRKRVVALGGLGALGLGLIGASLLADIADGQNRLTWTLLNNFSATRVDESGIKPAIYGTIGICIVCAIAAVPVGVGTAILLEEYRPKRPWLVRAHAFVQLNISNLAGVPSVVYGIIGLTCFVTMFGLFGTALNPAVRVGYEDFRRFQTLTDQAVRVRAGGTPIAEDFPQPDDEFLDAATMEPVELRVVDADETAEREAQLLRFERRGARSLNRLARRDPGEQAVIATLAESLDDAGLDPAKIELLPSSMLDEMMSSMRESGAAGTASRARAVQAVSGFIKEREFAGLISAGARATEDPIEYPWYVQLPFGTSILAGGLTLMLVVLPIVIIASQEALRAVPRSLRQASLALGATPWQTVWNTTLPSAVPGIMTGTILAMSRAIGEAAPILAVAGGVYVNFLPDNLMSGYSALPLQIFSWTEDPERDRQELAAAAIVVLLVVLLAFNATAVYIRQRSSNRQSA